VKNILFQSFIVIILFSFKISPQWVQQNLQGDINILIGIDFINQNKGVTGGWFGDLSQQIYGSAFSTSDGGNNWMPAITPDSIRVFVGLQMINDVIVYGAGAYNLSTQPDSHELPNFQNLKPYQQNFITGIGMDISGQENYRGYFVESTDGGLSWHPKGTLDDSVSYLVGMTFIDQSTGFVIGSSQNVSPHCILKTTNGGYNWYYVYPFSENTWIEQIKFFDNLNGVFVGEESSSGNGVFLKTTDGGENWIKSYPNNMSSIFSLAYIDLNNILIGGLTSYAESAIFKSTDGGINWEQFHDYTDFHFIDGIEVNSNSGIILVFGGYTPSGTNIPFIDVSLDNGITWNFSLFNQYQQNIFIGSKMVNETNWYICGGWVTTDGFVLFTDNAGGVPVELISFTAEAIDDKINLSWTTTTELNNLGFEVERKCENEDWRAIGFIEGKGTTTETQNYNFVDDLFGVADSKIFYRLKQIDFNGTFEYSKEIEVIRIAASFSLEQNYPNPFNPTTSIQYAISSRQFVTLKVYDILGNEVVTLVNEEKQPGSYEVEFSAKGGSASGGNAYSLPSGIYFYQLQSGNFVETKKMVLIK